MKTHYAVAYSTGVRPLCGRGRRMDTNVYRVDCLTCRGNALYHEDWKRAEAQREVEFQAQVPREYREPWREGVITCSGIVRQDDNVTICGSTLFRRGDRTCYGHYENYHCAECEHVESRLTETGMSF